MRGDKKLVHVLFLDEPDEQLPKRPAAGRCVQVGFGLLDANGTSSEEHRSRQNGIYLRDSESGKIDGNIPPIGVGLREHLPEIDLASTRILDRRERRSVQGLAAEESAEVRKLAADL